MVIVLSPSVPILIAPVLLSVPIPIVPPEESIVKFPSLWISIKPVPPPLFIAEINNVLSLPLSAVIVKLVVSVESIDKVVLSIVKSAALFIIIPFDPPSNSIASAFISTLVDSSAPMVIVLSPSVPILIFWSTLSFPKFIVPPDEFKFNDPEQSKLIEFPDTILRSVPSPDIYSPASPNWSCIDELSNNPVLWTWVKLTSESSPKFKTTESLLRFRLLSNCNLSRIRASPFTSNCLSGFDKLTPTLLNV